MLFVGAAASAYYAIGRAAEDDSPIFDTRGWTVWKVTVSLALAAAGALFLAACAAIWKTRVDMRADWRSIGGHTVFGFGLIACALGFISQEAATSAQWPNSDDVRSTLSGVAIAAAIAAWPWLVRVWLAHAELRKAGDWDLQRFREMWDTIVDCVTAFAVFVVIALVPAGALRAAWLGQQSYDDTAENAAVPPPCESTIGSVNRPGTAPPCKSTLETMFPASDVLLYGAFFAVLLAAVALPLVAAWRTWSQLYVDQEFRLDTIGQVTEENLANRMRLEQILHLDVGLLRNPLTALSLFTPLITSLLAAFLPELA